MLAQRTQLLAIADEGWRCGVDTNELSQLLYLRPPHQLSQDQAEEFLNFLCDQEGVPPRVPFDQEQG